ncbi:dicarboxylate/amino acid:cation symporter [Psychrobacillus sp. NPDC093180]|uniref:dicarboxylate/amino acid:cation symporter n=1 Tax=Psychrobacillus sp. NPDC093180 TaxID=3364489 RepID=UPI00380C573C
MGLFKKVGLVNQIIIAFVLALVVGVIFGPQAEIVKPLGTIFLRLIMFIIAPLVLSTLIVGMASTGSIHQLGRMGFKTMAYYLITTGIAVIIGLVLAFWIAPGKGIGTIKPTGEVPEGTASMNFLDVLINIIPQNSITAMAENNMLQIIFLAILIGIGITVVGKKADPVYNFFDGLAEVMMKLTSIIMKIVPIGVFGLLAPIIGIHGLDVIVPLLKLLLTVAIGCTIQYFVVYSTAVKGLGKMSPIQFFKGVMPATLMAFGTQSSSGTLPLTMKCAEEKLGVSNKVSSFVLPLGATVSMDGQAIYIAVSAIFTAQMFGVELTFQQIVLIALISTIGSLGTAGVPGAGIIMLTVALSTVNLPLEAIAIIAGIDRFLNMFSTACNVTGDIACAVYVEAAEKRRLEKEEVPATSLDKVLI